MINQAPTKDYKM